MLYELWVPTMLPVCVENFMICITVLHSFTYTNCDLNAGGLVWISGWNSLQHATNAAFLAVVYSDYMLTSQTAAVECSGKYFSPTDIRNFAISQVNADYYSR
jgi:hypothetical protein